MAIETAILPSPPKDLSEEAQQEFLRLHQLAHFLRHHMAAAAVFAGVSSTIGTDRKDLEAFQLYVQQLKRDAGNPADPAEQMLIEQLALAHHNIARLSNRASTAKTLDESKVVEAAMARLLGEFRRTAMALKEFREPKTQSHFTLVKQQNLAQNQQVAYVEEGSQADDEEASASEEAEEESLIDSELVSNESQDLEDAEETQSVAQPEESDRRETESVEA